MLCRLNAYLSLATFTRLTPDTGNLDGTASLSSHYNGSRITVGRFLAEPKNSFGVHIEEFVWSSESYIVGLLNLLFAVFHRIIGGK